jgi:hypothetical protein
VIMKFTTKCAIMFEKIKKEDGYLVKVPAPKNTDEKKTTEKDKFYYVGCEDTLVKLQVCPLTRRVGEYFVVKLSQLNETEMNLLLKENEENVLIEDNDTLNQATAEFKWESKIFKKEAYRPPETTREELLRLQNEFNNENLNRQPQVLHQGRNNFGLFQQGNNFPLLPNAQPFYWPRRQFMPNQPQNGHIIAPGLFALDDDLLHPGNLNEIRNINPGRHRPGRGRRV